MERKGFTLVELIVVIVIIGVLAVILIPTITSSSKNSKEKILATKVETTNQALVLWAQNNRKCFFSDATSYGDECLIGLNKGCGKKLDNPNVLQCEISYGTLAEFGIIKYDDENNNVVVNPTNHNSMNSEKVTLEYNINTKTFCNGVGCTKDVTTTKKVLDVPELIVNPESDEEWSESKIINVTVSGGTSGLSVGGTIEYGFSTSQKEAPEYTNYPLVYADGDNNTTFNIVGSNLSGKYYLWLKPSITSKNGISLPNKITGPYYFDIPNLKVNLLATKDGTNAVVESNVWSDKGLNYKLSLEEDNNNYTIYYCKDTENTCNPTFPTTNNMLIRSYVNEVGEYYIRYKVVTKAGNSSEVGSYHAKVDTASPLIKSAMRYQYDSTKANNVGSRLTIMGGCSNICDFKNSKWENFGSTFEFEIGESLSGIKSIVWKWNNPGSSTDTGDVYPEENIALQNPPYTKIYATLTAPGYRKGQLILTGNNGKVTTQTVAVQIDSCDQVTYQDGTICSNTCGSGTYNKLAYSKYSGNRCTAKDTTSGGSACTSNTGCPASKIICSKSSSNGMHIDRFGDCRYVGKSPNNFVSFNNELWRIIGVFDVAKTNGGAVEQRLKIRRYDTLGKSLWSENNSNVWANSTLASELNNKYAKGVKIPNRYRDDVWNPSTWPIMTIGTSALDATAQNLIDNAVWNVGLTKFNTGISSIFTDEEKTTWVGKVGLASATDVFYSSSACVDGGGSLYGFAGPYANDIDCRETSWFASDRSWTMTALQSDRTYSCHAVLFELNGYQGFYANHVGTMPATVGVKPVVYLKANVKITGGSGTSSNPYTLSL